jgi:hypothetical protein
MEMQDFKNLKAEHHQLNKSSFPGLALPNNDEIELDLDFS